MVECCAMLARWFGFWHWSRRRSSRATLECINTAKFKSVEANNPTKVVAATAAGSAVGICNNFFFQRSYCMLHLSWAIFFASSICFSAKALASANKKGHLVIVKLPFNDFFFLRKTGSSGTSDFFGPPPKSSSSSSSSSASLSTFFSMLYWNISTWF